MDPNARQDTMRAMYEALRRKIKPTPQELQALAQNRQNIQLGLETYVRSCIDNAGIVAMWTTINQNVQTKVATGQTLVKAVKDLNKYDFIKHTTKFGQLAISTKAITSHADWVTSNAALYQQRYERYAHNPVRDNPNSPWSLTKLDQVDRWIAACQTDEQTLLARIGNLAAAQTTLASDVAEMLRETAIEAYVIKHKSEVHKFTETGFAILSGATTALGAAAPPGWAAVPGAVAFAEGIIRRVVGAGLTAYEVHQFDQKNAADQGFREMDRDPTAIANRLYEGYMDHLGTMLDAVGIALIAVPGWPIARSGITGFVREALDKKLAAAGDADRRADRWIRLVPDKDSWVEKITDVIVTAIRAAAEVPADVTQLLEIMAGGIAGQLVAKLINWSPAQRVTGDDLTASSRQLLAAFERNLPPGIRLATAADKVALAAKAKAETAAAAESASASKPPKPDRSVLPPAWRNRVADVLSVLTPTSWNVLMEGMSGTLATADGKVVFTPDKPDAAEITPNDTWKNREILPDRGYSVGGAVTGGVWYKPWPDKNYYLLSGVPNAKGHEWALGAATTANGDGSTRYDVARMLDGRAVQGFPPRMASRWQ